MAINPLVFLFLHRENDVLLRLSEIPQFRKPKDSYLFRSAFPKSKEIRLRRKVAVRLVDVDDAPVRSRLFRGHAHNAVAALKCGRLPAKWFADAHGHSFLMSPPHCSAIALAMPGKVFARFLALSVVNIPLCCSPCLWL